MSYAAVVIVAITGTACTRHHHASSVRPGTRVRAEMADGATVRGTVTVYGGRVVVIDEADQPRSTGIVRMTSVDRHRGAMMGMPVGLLAGVAIGAAVGYARGDDTCIDDDDSWFGTSCVLTLSATEKAFLVGGLLGIAGAGTGALIGAIIGSRDVYSAGASRELRVIPGGPPGAVAGATIQF